MRWIIELLRRRLHIVPVDFDQAWWRVIVVQKRCLVVAFLGEVASGIFSPLRIILLGWIFSSGRFDYLVYLFVVWLLIYALNFIARFNNTIVQMRAVQSVTYQAHKRLLQVDPVFHANRSSGTILSKIDRGARAYEDLLQTIFFDLVELPISVITAVVSLAYYSPLLASVTVFFLGAIVFLSTVVMRRIIALLEQDFIKADDFLKSLCVENLFQINFIRTTFASTFMNSKMQRAAGHVMEREALLACIYNVAFTLIKCIYLVSFITVCIFTLKWIAAGTIAATMGFSLVLSYMRGTYDIIRVEKPLRIVFKSIIRIKDLFAYLATCGEQTFPVLREVSAKTDNVVAGNVLPTVTIGMKNLFFDYAASAKIFDDHSLNLAVSRHQAIKLYGIIGPSGIGKSTFLSMLGGQLRPTAGQVLIDAIDIYTVDDVERQRLIALQGQSVTSVRGSLKYNLLFGLPDDAIKHDGELATILEQVGLWELFKAKDGLQTHVGEGGLTLSGGQRQRLNFANLYLRAKYFKPGLILIDEPTSSLDDMSEKKITEMIIALSRDAVTLVIAHRLNTVAHAVGLLDCSLLSSEKEMKFYTHAELLERSIYYRGLMSGNEALENDGVQG